MAERKGLSAHDVSADADEMRSRADALLPLLSISDAELAAGHARMYPTGCPAWRDLGCSWCAHLGEAPKPKRERVRRVRARRRR